MTAADPELRVTLFDDVAAQSLEVRYLRLSGLADLIRSTFAPDKTHLPLLKMGVFGDYRTRKGSLRHDRNLHFISGVELDFDSETISFEDAVAVAEKLPLRCILYTSPSHMLNGHGPRWRLLAPLSQELPRGDRKRLVDRINGAYATHGATFNSESWTDSQTFYFGVAGGSEHFELTVVDGEPVDLLHDLDLIAKGKVRGSSTINGHAFEGSTQGLTETALAALIRSGEHYHEPVLRLATIWAREGLDQDEAEDRLIDLFDEVAAELQDPDRWRRRRAEVPRCVADMYLNVEREEAEREARQEAGLAGLEERTGSGWDATPAKTNGATHPSSGGNPWSEAIHSEEFWPEIDAAAFHGLVGDIVRTIDPISEADRVATLAQTLAVFGCAFGRGAYSWVGETKHYPNLFQVIVGISSKARKGTSYDPIETMITRADPTFGDCVRSGLSSGEGVIHSAHDGVWVNEKVSQGRGNPPTYEKVLKEEPIKDKRLFVIEQEFASLLSTMQRQGNNLSPVLRQAWDGRKLQTVTKHNAETATGAHLSVVGHITTDELQRLLNQVSISNGFGNRFLFILVRRSKELPFPGRLHDAVIETIAGKLHKLFTTLDWRKNCVEFAPDACELWKAEYRDLSAEKPGLFGSLVARAEAQTLRLAMIYALLDRTYIIQPTHLRAALAFWRYCEASARYIFGDALGDPVADTILQALRRVAPDAMTRYEISQMFAGNRTSEQISKALMLLAKHGKACLYRIPTSGKGRPPEAWKAC
jgi:hypothetical protein